MELLSYVFRTRISNAVDLHGWSGSDGVVGDVIGEVDEKLRKTPFCSCVITEDRREGGITERFRKALTEGLASAVIITESVAGVSMKSRHERYRM
jgi:hypothetical protein